MSNLGWCTAHGAHEDCPGVVALSGTNTHGTHFGCDCKHHEGESAMANSGPSRARAYRPTADEVEAGEVAESTEVVLEITDVKSEEIIFIETTFAGAHAARDALAGLLHEHASRSIVQKLEDELDGVMETLMLSGDGYDGAEAAEAAIEARGWARGLGTAIALMRGCDMDAVREAAMARYEEKVAS